MDAFTISYTQRCIHMDLWKSVDIKLLLSIYVLCARRLTFAHVHVFVIEYVWMHIRLLVYAHRWNCQLYGIVINHYVKNNCYNQYIDRYVHTHDIFIYIYICYPHRFTSFCSILFSMAIFFLSYFWYFSKKHLKVHSFYRRVRNSSKSYIIIISDYIDFNGRRLFLLRLPTCCLSSKSRELKDDRSTRIKIRLKIILN